MARVPCTLVVRRAALATLVIAAAVEPLGLRPAAADGAPSGPAIARSVWVRPVDGAVVEPFRASLTPYGPGHRGADLAAPPGTAVRSAGPGTIAFAGSVAGTQHVVVDHGDGLRTSYSFLARVVVRPGARVDAGDVIGIAGGSGPAHPPGRVHVGLRRGDRYLDPMLLFAPRDLTGLVRLVPARAPGRAAWAVPAREAARIGLDLSLPVGGPVLPTIGDEGCADRVPLVGAVVDAVCAGVGEAVGSAAGGLEAGLGLLRRSGATGQTLATRLAGPARQAIRALATGAASSVAEAFAGTPAGRALHDLAEVGGRLRAWAGQRCSGESPPADGTGGSGHRLLAVGGIDSRTRADGRTFGLDADALGYHPDEVQWFSYAPSGGRYGPAATHGPLERAATRLAAQLRAMQGAQPGREVDLVAHSQGGVVVDTFLQGLYDAGDPTYPPIGTVVTLASPHRGAPLATSGERLRSSRSGRLLLAAAGSVAPGPPSGAPAVRQLAETSSTIRRVQRRRMPDQIELTSIGGVDDPVVPANRIGLQGATEVALQSGGLLDVPFDDHSELPHDPGALRAVRAALEGRPPPCTSWLEGVRGAIEPVLLTRAEHAVGSLAAGPLGGRVGP